ncbi:SPATS2-like protein isoform X4 [Anolis sagrei]|uniref:SPATS2-like protein isoform X4 n=1 Tax=Anolis sagrei TaxID=38937 RepID=UPI003520A8BC
MAEISSQVNIKEKINAVRSIVPNKSNNEIVLVLQQFDNNVHKAVQAFVDGSALQVLKEWNMTGKKKNSKRKRSKSKQHYLSKDAKDKDERVEKTSLELQELNGCHLNDCDKETFFKPAGEKSTMIPQEEKSLEYKERRETNPESSGPNIEKSVKDLQRCTVSLTRYRMMIKEEVDNSVKKIKAAFAELHSCIIDREVTLMAEVDKVKEEAMEILTARQKKAEELKRLTDLASQMAETQLAELRAEIKHFVSERKYDEELGRSARFSCDIEQLKTQILQCGEISHPKNNYSSRTPSSTLPQSATLHAAAGIQSAYIRKPFSRARGKAPDGRAVITKGFSQSLTSSSESSPQIISTNKQNGPSNQRRRFHGQYHSIRINGSHKPQSASIESDQNNTKGSAWHEYRRPHHSGFRPRNKGSLKTQEQPAIAKTTEDLMYPEKTRRKHPTSGPIESRSLCSNITRVSQCNLCPSSRETSADAPVLSVPAVTLVA